MRLIVVSGPESSGKTTLVHDLAKHFGSDSVEEYARWYLEGLPRPYEFRDLLAICRGQELQMLKKRYHSKGEFLFIDTWALVLMIWSEYKYQTTHICFYDLLERYEIERFLLCYPDIPWVEDPLRENPDDRMDLFHLYDEKLRELGIPFNILEGSMDDKLQSAIGILDSAN